MMTVATPSHTDVVVRARRSVARGARLARFSGLSLLVIGGVSVLVCIFDPLSVSMLVSVAVAANGLVEWKNAGRLKALEAGATGVLAANQTALAIEIVLYVMWRAETFDPAMLDSILRQPLVVMVLEVYPPEVVEMVVVMLPVAVRLLFFLLGIAAVVGCLGMALFYRSRRKYVLQLKNVASGT